MNTMAVMAIAVTPTDTEPVSEPTDASPGETADGPAGDPGREAAVRILGGLVLDGRPLTWHDLQQLPDGLRYELVDGVLLVSPSPIRPHQRVAARLIGLLGAALPPDLEVLGAPFDWLVSETTVLEPDVLVARADDPGERWLEAVPLMVTEILSPSTRLRDLGLKRLAYQECGVEWYWVIDPDPDEPRLTVFRLEDGHYVEEAVVVGDEKYVAGEPLNVSVVPRELVERRRRQG